MNFSKRLLLILTITLSCVSCDQATKSVARLWLENTGSWTFGILKLELAYNKGAFLSLGSEFSEYWREGLFSIGNGFLLCALLSYVLFSKSVSKPLMIGIALLFAGGLSNLADRVFNSGYVIDFINLGIGSLRTGVFNIADIAIMLGAIFLIVDMINLQIRH
jgi:signal peptidase II